MSPPSDFDAYLAFAHDLADEARGVVLPHFRREIAIDNKASGADFDPVTAADRGVEEFITRRIAERFPAHGIVGEEYGDQRTDARLKWVIDPIDGTRSFIIGSPLWGTLIGLVEDGKPLLGIVDQPYTGERFWSTASGAMMRDPAGRERSIATRKCTRLADAILTTTQPELFSAPAEAAAFGRVKAKVRMTRYGGDCYGYCLLAAGFVDCIIESGLKPFDIVALIPIIERAGGCVTSWDGGPPDAGGQILATGDRALHDQVLSLLARA